MPLGRLDYFSSVMHPITRPPLLGEITWWCCRSLLSHNYRRGVIFLKTFFNKTDPSLLCQISERYLEHQILWPIERSKCVLEWALLSPDITLSDFFFGNISKARFMPLSLMTYYNLKKESARPVSEPKEWCCQMSENPVCESGWRLPKMEALMWRHTANPQGRGAWGKV